MLDYLRGKASDRKLRLFAAACCRQNWHVIKADRVRQAIGVAERYADGQVDRADLTRAYLTLSSGDLDIALLALNQDAFHAACRVSEVAARRVGVHAEWLGGSHDLAAASELHAHCESLRD